MRKGARVDMVSLEECVKFRSHSVMLNQVAWRLSELLGEVGPGDTVRYGDGDVLARLNRYAESRVQT